MYVVSSIIQTLLISALELLYLFGVVMALGLVLGVFERFSNTYLMRSFGPRAVLITAWIGVPIHEIGHLLQCFIWGHKVKKVKLLQLNRSDGVLGYVEHQFNPNNFYQQVGNFFIGLGPLFSGIGCLILGMYFLIPESYFDFTAFIHQNVTPEKQHLIVLTKVGGAVVALLKSLLTIENLLKPSFWIYLWIAISISSHIALSKPDVKGAGKGLLWIFFLLILFNIFASFLQIDSYQIIGKITEYNVYVLAFSSIAILFSLVTVVLSYSLYQLKIRMG